MHGALGSRHVVTNTAPYYDVVTTLKGLNGAPTTPAGKQAAAALWFNQALATFLIAAEDNMWFGYSWFWTIGDYVPFDADAQHQHTCPDDFYPETLCKLGYVAAVHHQLPCPLVPPACLNALC